MKRMAIELSPENKKQAVASIRRYWPPATSKRRHT